MKTTIRRLRAFTKEILSAVNRGTTVLVTNRGKPYVKIVPVSATSKTEKSKDPLFGIWKNYKEVAPVRAYIRNLRKARYAR